MRTIRFSGQAESDFRKILKASELEFGQEVARRYKHLLNVAFEEIMSDSDIVGSQSVERHPKLIRYPIHWSSLSAKVEGDS